MYVFFKRKTAYEVRISDWSSDVFSSDLILILLTLMVSSKGIAAVPRASLVVITATLAMFDLPVEGVALVFAIDHFLDMGRTATNVVGNAVATSVITKWEGMLEVPEAADAERPDRKSTRLNSSH